MAIGRGQIDLGEEVLYGSGHDTAAVLLPRFAINW